MRRVSPANMLGREVAEYDLAELDVGELLERVHLSWLDERRSDVVGVLLSERELA